MSVNILNNVVADITPFSNLDYKGYTSCILWFAGCNLRCKYCYNPEIVKASGKFSWEVIETFLESRKGLLDAVVFSGGECLIHYSILGMLSKVKAMGFKTKIDTNGTKPNMLKQIINSNLVDFIALDCKELEPTKYNDIVGTDRFSPEGFKECLEVLLNSSVPFEVRTTVHSKFFNEIDIINLSKELYKLGYRGEYAIQKFMQASTLGNLENTEPFNTELIKAKSPLKPIFRAF